MNRKLCAFSTAIGALAFAASAFAATAKTYQVTGPVLEVNKDMIVVQKGKDRWEIARDASTKMSADVKAGDKVTIQYRMIATEVEAKTQGAKKAPAKKKSK